MFHVKHPFDILSIEHVPRAGILYTICIKRAICGQCPDASLALVGEGA